MAVFCGIKFRLKEKIKPYKKVQTNIKKILAFGGKNCYYVNKSKNLQGIREVSYGYF